MKRTFTSFLLIALSITFCKAQTYVAIPDANFAGWLSTNGFGSCMNGNNLNIDDPLVANATTIDCHGRSISDLTGIENFQNLTTLICGDNNLTAMPSLPPNLQVLTCYSNQLTSLSGLPETITYLDCSYNQINYLFLPYSLDTLMCQNNRLTDLPGWPYNLSYVDFSQNKVTTVYSLPDNVRYLNCRFNQISSIPSPPATLKTLLCSGNFLTALPALPNGLTDLEVDNNSGMVLPATLPDSLLYFICDYITVSGLPPLPSQLTELSASNCGLTSLPALPNNLGNIYVSGNQLSGLPALPAYLSYLDCSSNQITSLPALPDFIISLYCGANQLTALPSLPAELQGLFCPGNKLTALPLLQSSNLFELDCSQNQLTALPDLPQYMGRLNVSYNPGLICLPPLKTFSGNNGNFSVAQTGITCLPNVIAHTGSIPAIDTMPICGLFNPGGCSVSWNIKGQAVKDADGDCNTLNDGTPLQNISVKLYDSGNNLVQQQYVNGGGNYSFATRLGTFTVKADTASLPFSIVCPTGATHTSVLTALDSLDYAGDFRFTCKPGFDLGVNSIGTSQNFFPNDYIAVPIFAGDEATYYNIGCNTDGLGGTVTATVTGPVTITLATSNPGTTSNVTGNTATWNVTDFSQIDVQHTFALALHTDVLAQAGEQVCITATISPATGTDRNPANNSLSQCFTVTNSHDPNSKEVSPAGAILTGYSDYLTYTIHFQNTGTAAARSIQVLDTISNNLDISTFQLVAFSNPCVTQVFANSRVVKFGFPNINLADSTTDKANSTGYVQYKIKPIANLAAGNSISNTAYIYFDFNSPVVTNTATNSVEVATAVKNIIAGNEVRVYPNPASSWLVIDCELLNSKLEITDVLGRTLIAQQTINKETTVDVSHLSGGVYFVRVQTGGAEVVKKFVKE